MPYGDMLVKLYTLPDVTTLSDDLRRSGVEIRLAYPTEKAIVVDWVSHHFSEGWAKECEVAFGQYPVTCYLAVEATPASAGDGSEGVIGFACYDVTRKGVFGPEGVREESRGRGIGKALLLSSLYAMEMAGYAYAVIGWVGPAQFYAKTVGATMIKGSQPRAYRKRPVSERPKNP
jgi:hypothetical protein